MIQQSNNAGNAVSSDLQQTLNQIAEWSTDRKDEVIDLLSDEQPRKSRLIESFYDRCIWWEGCYYCQDENKQWQRVKCFM